MKCSARVYRLEILFLDCSKRFGSLVKTSAVRSERAADVSRFFCTSAWLGVRSSAYAQADIQTSAALSERAAYSYQYPGFRFAHRFAPPWAEVSYAFGVLPENAAIAELFYAKQIQGRELALPFHAPWK